MKNTDKIIEILIEELCKELTEDNRVKNTNDFYQRAGTRIDSLYSGGVSEEDINDAADRLIPHEPGSQYVYDGFMICAKWMKSHPTPETSEEEIQDTYDLYCDRSQNVQTILGHPPQYEPLMSREAFMKVIKEWTISKGAQPEIAHCTQCGYHYDSLLKECPTCKGAKPISEECDFCHREIHPSRIMNICDDCSQSMP